MKKLLLLFTDAFLILSGSAFPQELMDYVSTIKGDTLVIKDYYEMNNQPNSLYYVLYLDTVNVPAGRVYELKVNGYYSNEIQPRTSANRHTVIVGSDPTPVVNNKNENSSPPLICNEPAMVDPAPIGIEARGDLTIKNCALVSAGRDGTVNWAFASVSAPNIRLTIDNCVLERTLWVFVSAAYENCDLIFRNCCFINMSGYSGRQLGGVYDSFADQDTLIVENCTHLMAQGNLYSIRYISFNRIIINHNTFINCAGNVFMNSGYQPDFSLTNNIFINSNIHPQEIGFLSDLPNPDPDALPVGLVNVNPYPLDSSINTQRKFLVQSNLVYWSSILFNCDSILNANKVNGNNWKSQTIIMNSRTQSMFKDDVSYPYLVTDTWKNKMPDFADPEDLFTTQLANLMSFAIESAETSSTVSLPAWRLINTEFENFVNPDWPVQVDLSYNDADLLTAGMGGFPLGDLNWFPDRKADWFIQRSAEYDSIHNALNSGRLVTALNDYDAQPVDFRLWQNYPNPFNPSTTISFSIPEAGYVILKVYDISGREVATLLDGFKTPEIYNIKFNGSGLASGVYFCRLTAFGMEQVMKMVLAK